MKIHAVFALMLSLFLITACGNDKKKKDKGFQVNALSVVEGQFIPGQGVRYPGTQYQLHPDSYNVQPQQLNPNMMVQPLMINGQPAYRARITGMLVPSFGQMNNWSGFNQQPGTIQGQSHMLRITQIQLY